MPLKFFSVDPLEKGVIYLFFLSSSKIIFLKLRDKEDVLMPQTG